MQVEDGPRATGKTRTAMETAADSMVIAEDSEAGGPTLFKDKAALGKEKGKSRGSSPKKEKEKKKKSKKTE